MTRTSRLLKLMDLLRGRRRPVTAADLADRLSVSVRTVYRDVQALIDFGASIEGSAGVGYLLRSGFFLPPLMFGDEEIEALVLGARWVEGQGDPALALAANAALAKISAASPKDLRERIAETGLWAPRASPASEPSTLLATVRAAIREERKLQLRYSDVDRTGTERIVWPVALGFFEGKRMIAAWCELRQDFRHFRADRITDLQLLTVPYPRSRRELAKSWRQQLKSMNAG